MTCCIPHLLDLDISSCSIGNASLRAISARLTNLRRLRLARCRELTDSCLLGTVDMDFEFPHDDDGDDELGHCLCTHLHHRFPHIFSVPKQASKKPLPPKSEHDLNEAEFRPLTNLRSLQLLDLKYCNRITDQSVSQVMSFNEMRCLCLSLCTKLTDVSLAAVSVGLPSLEELHLALLGCITDAGVREISERLHRLSFLDVSSCDQLTDRSIETLFHNTKTLRHLDVSLCTGISGRAVAKLKRDLDHLVLVNRRHQCSRKPVPYLKNCFLDFQKNVKT